MGATKEGTNPLDFRFPPIIFQTKRLSITTSQVRVVRRYLCSFPPSCFLPA